MAGVGCLVLAGLLGFVTLVYAVVVLLGGALLGRDRRRPAWPSRSLATASSRWPSTGCSPASRAAPRALVHGGQRSPYDVLRRFSGTVTGRYAAEELPARMARVLAEGTGAAWAQVWLVVGDRPTLAATWPPERA